MPAKPPSTVASKTPATASKAPASKKPAGEKGAKTAKKTSAGADGEKKGAKKRKIRKETYGSYIYKGESISTCGLISIVLTWTWIGSP